MAADRAPFICKCGPCPSSAPRRRQASPLPRSQLLDIARSAASMSCVKPLKPRSINPSVRQEAALAPESVQHSPATFRCAHALPAESSSAEAGSVFSLEVIVGGDGGTRWSNWLSGDSIVSSRGASATLVWAQAVNHNRITMGSRVSIHMLDSMIRRNIRTYLRNTRIPLCDESSIHSPEERRKVPAAERLRRALRPQKRLPEVSFVQFFNQGHKS